MLVHGRQRNRGLVAGFGVEGGVRQCLPQFGSGLGHPLLLDVERAEVHPRQRECRRETQRAAQRRLRHRLVTRPALGAAELVQEIGRIGAQAHGARVRIGRLGGLAREAQQVAAQCVQFREIGRQRERPIQRGERVAHVPGFTEHRRQIAPGIGKTGLRCGRVAEGFRGIAGSPPSIQRKSDADERAGVARIGDHGGAAMRERQRQIAGGFSLPRQRQGPARCSGVSFGAGAAHLRARRGCP